MVESKPLFQGLPNPFIEQLKLTFNWVHNDSIAIRSNEVNNHISNVSLEGKDKDGFMVVCSKKQRKNLYSETSSRHYSDQEETYLLKLLASSSTECGDGAKEFMTDGGGRRWW